MRLTLRILSALLRYPEAEVVEAVTEPVNEPSPTPRRTSPCATAPTGACAAALGTTSRRQGSRVMTDAERGPSSRSISPKHSPGPCSFSTNSRPDISS